MESLFGRSKERWSEGRTDEMLEGMSGMPMTSRWTEGQKDTESS